MNRPKAFVVFNDNTSFTNCLQFCQDFNLDVADSFAHFPIIFVYDAVDALILIGYIHNIHIQDHCIYEIAV